MQTAKAPAGDPSWRGGGAAARPDVASDDRRPSQEKAVGLPLCAPRAECAAPQRPEDRAWPRSLSGTAALSIRLALCRREESSGVARPRRPFAFSSGARRSLTCPSPQLQPRRRLRRRRRLRDLLLRRVTPAGDAEPRRRPATSASSRAGAVSGECSRSWGETPRKPTAQTDAISFGGDAATSGARGRRFARSRRLAPASLEGRAFAAARADRSRRRPLRKRRPRSDSCRSRARLRQKASAGPEV